MTVTSVDTDYDSLSITLIADFDASIDQVWVLWSDPRELERWGARRSIRRPSRTRPQPGR